MSDETPEPWHFDKKVPLALIGTLIVQTITVVWWASGIHHRVATVEAMQLVLASRTTTIEAASRTEVAALRTELQTRNERTLEGQRSLSEQIIEQRADVKAIRTTLGGWRVVWTTPPPHLAQAAERDEISDIYATKPVVARHTTSALALSCYSN